MAFEDDYLPAFLDEIKSIVKTRFGVDDDHYFTSIQALRQNLMEAIKKAEAGGTKPNITAPLAVASVGELVNDDQWGLCNLAKRAPTTIWYVIQNKDRDNQKHANSRVYDLAQFIDRNDFDSFQSIESARTNSGESDAANVYFVDSQLELTAAAVSWTPGLLLGEFAED